MEVWMVVVTFTVLVATTGVFLFVVFYERRREEQKDEFFRELDQTAVQSDGVAGLPLPTVEIAAYEQALQSIHDKFFPDEPLEPVLSSGSEEEDEDNDEEEEDDDEAPPTDPAETEGEVTASRKANIPWHRRLPAEQRATLKTLLVKRAMATIPSVTSFINDYSARYRLNQLQMMDPRHWKRIEGFSESLDKELSAIRREAEAIEEGWGAKELIFRDANIFYQHELSKVKKAKEAARLEAERVKNEAKAAVAADKEKRQADKMMQALLKQEENVTNQKKAAAAAKPSGRKV